MSQQRTIQSIGKLISAKADSLPKKATIVRVDQNLADISVGAGSGVIHNVEIQGNADNIVPGMMVTIAWYERQGGYSYPVVLGGGSGGGLLISSSSVAPFTVDNATIQMVSRQLSVKDGGIQFNHLSFVPSLEGHTHNDMWQTAGWTIEGTDTIRSSSAMTRIMSNGKILLGDLENVIALDSTHATYRLWAGASDPANAIFKIGKDGKIYATAGDIGGWNIGATQLDADNGQVILNSATPFIGFGGADAYGETGIWMGKDGAAYKFYIGNPAGNHLSWDGSTLILTGRITATTGMIGGWTLGANDFYSGLGAAAVHLSSNTAGTYAIWAGAAAAVNAPFWVKRSGEIMASSGTIGGWVITADSIGCGGPGNDLIRLDTSQLAINLGGLQGYMSDTGFWVGFDQDDYVKMHIGNPTADFMAWNGTKLITSGEISQAPTTLGTLGGIMVIAYDEGKLPVDITAAQTTIYFGRQMTPDDFIMIRSRNADGVTFTEHIQIKTLVSGTTYNVLRGRSSAGAGYPWSMGTLYAVIGHANVGRLELGAYPIPRVSVKVKQGFAWDGDIEPVRVGELSYWQLAGLTGYGMAMGDYAANKFLYYTPADGLVVRGDIRADDGYLGNLDVSGTLAVGTSGKIVLNDERTGVTIGYITDGYYIRGTNNGLTQFEMKASDGKLYAGGGDVIIDENGVRLLVESGHFDTNTIRWVDHANPAATYYTLGMRISNYGGSNYLENAQLVSAPSGYGASWYAFANTEDAAKAAQVYFGTTASDGEVDYVGAVNLYSDPVAGKVVLDLYTDYINIHPSTVGLTKAYLHGGLRVTSAANYGPGNDFGQIYEGAITAEKLSYSQPLDPTSGWGCAEHSWTYASATTFTVAGNLTKLYQAGTKLRWKEGATQKFGNVIASVYSNPNTTVTISPSVDYAFTNTTLTDRYFSKSEIPEDWPEWFVYGNNTNANVIWTCASGTAPVIGNGTLLFRYKLQGKTILIQGYLAFGNTSTFGNGGNWNFALPVTAEAGTLGNWLGVCHCRQTNSWARIVQISPGASIIQYFFDPHAGTNTNFLNNTTPVAWSVGNVQFSITYKYA